MEIGDFIEISIILGYYKNILSDKQKEYMVEHFEEDYSLTEIGEKYGVSRQAVHNNIKFGIQLIKEYEEKLGFYKRDKEIKKRLDEIKENPTSIQLKKIIEDFYE